MLLGHASMPATLSLCLTLALCAWAPAAVLEASGSAGEAGRMRAEPPDPRATPGFLRNWPPPGPRAPVAPTVLAALAERAESPFERDYLADAAAVAVLIEAYQIHLYVGEGGVSEEYRGLHQLLEHRDVATRFEAGWDNARHVWEESLSAQSLAFHRILAHRNAAAMFEHLVRHAGQPGQLHGLGGLYLVDRARFQEVMRSYRPRDASVSLLSGCIGFQKPVEEMLAEIEAGNLQRLVTGAAAVNGEQPLDLAWPERSRSSLAGELRRE